MKVEKNMITAHRSILTSRCVQTTLANMRTTVTIDDDIYAAARNVASLKHIAIGVALSELARRGLENLPRKEADHQFPGFEVSEKAMPFGLDEIKTAEDEQ
jgi:hypothetical protein